MDTKQLNLAYIEAFTDADKHSRENVEKMETLNLYRDLDKLVNILSNGNLEGLPGEAYIRVFIELVNRYYEEIKGNE